MRIYVLVFYTLILFGCSSNQTDSSTKNSNVDFINEYIKKLVSEGKIRNKPLIVIDGFPLSYFDFQLNKIPFGEADIKDIDYLEKDNKTSIYVYGDRAKDGVLLIISTGAPSKLLRPASDDKILILLDSIQISRTDFEKLDHDEIELVSVIDDKVLIKNYTKEEFEKVVIITLNRDSTVNE